MKKATNGNKWFYDRFPSYLVKWSNPSLLSKFDDVYIDYFDIYADSFGNTEYSVDAIKEDILDCCLDKMLVRQVLEKYDLEGLGFITVDKDDLFKELGL